MLGNILPKEYLDVDVVELWKFLCEVELFKSKFLANYGYHVM